MKRIGIVYAVLATLPVFAWVAEGCSSDPDANNANGSNVDGGALGSDIDATGIVTQNDSGNTSPKDSGGGTVSEGGSDGGVTLPGTMISTGNNIQIVGTTSDGYVVYIDSSGADAGAGVDGSDVAALKVAAPGKPPAVITADFNEDTDDLAIDGMTVAYYANVSATGIASVSIWTAANGVKALTTTGVDGIYASAADGSYVAYATNASATTGDVDLDYVKTDGTGGAAIIVGESFTTSACPPLVGFTKGVAFASSCTGKATTATLRSIDTAVAGSKVISVDTALMPGYFNADPTATFAFTIKNAKTVGTIDKVAGGGAVTEAQNTDDGFLDSTGANVIYHTTTPAGLFTAKTATPVGAAEITGGDGGVNGILGHSTDNTWALINFAAVDTTTNPNIPQADMNIVATAAASTPTVLGFGQPVGFDSTSKYFFYVTGIAKTATFVEGALKSHAVAGGADKTIAADAALPVVADGTTKVVYLGNASASGIDILVGDATGTTAPVTVVPQVDGSFDVKKGNIFYTAGGGKFLYYVAVP